MNRTAMKPSATAADVLALQELRKLVNEGEGLQLEFKRKASHPEKIVRELIAFANTEGGTLLIGVDDDKSIPGVKYPDEESHGVREVLKQNCRPALAYHETLVSISENRYVIRIDIPPSLKRPHYLTLQSVPRTTFVRVADKSIKASAEMEEIVRRGKKKKDIRFVFGEHEKQLLEYLSHHSHITLSEFRFLSGLNRFQASRKLILLVLANILNVTATEKGDLYSRV